MTTNKTTDATIIYLNGERLSHVVSVTTLKGYGDVTVATLSAEGKLQVGSDGNLITNTLTGEIWSGAA